MNTDQLKRDILLSQTGELSPRRQRRLERALTDSAELRAWKQDAEQTSRMFRTASSDPGPSSHTLETISQTARGHVVMPKTQHPAVSAVPLWQWVAVAALLMLCLAGGALLWRGESGAVSRTASTTASSSTAPQWETGLDEEMRAWSDRLDAAREAWTEDALADASNGNGDTDAEDLARELLKLEGVNI